MGHHELDSPPWVITYWVFILGYFQSLLNKLLLRDLEKYFKISSHYYVMVYIKNILKIYHCQKNSSPFTSPFITLN
jgi:hypothetical protein